MKNILAITPFLGNSGSEIAFVNLLNNLSKDFKIKIFTPKTNPENKENLHKEIALFQDYRARNHLEKIWFKVRSKNILEELLSEKPNLVFLNTLLSLKYLDHLDRPEIKKILYVHETEEMLVNLSMNELKRIINEIDLILCCSKRVRDYLELLGCNGNLEILYPSICYKNFHVSYPKRKIRSELGIPEDSFVWGMSGALLLNKNPQAFLNIAKIMLQRNHNSKFLWIGASGNYAYEEYLNNWLKKYNLEKVVYILPRMKDNYFDYLNEIDAFLHTSYSESFSMAALEAVGFNKPVVSFPNGGVYESVPDSYLKVTRDFSLMELLELMEKQIKENPKNLTDSEIQHLFQFEEFSLSLKFKEYLQNHRLIN